MDEHTGRRFYVFSQDSDYEIYGSTFYPKQILDPVMRSRYHLVGYDRCQQLVLRSKRAACLDDCLHMYTGDSVPHLHRSKMIQQSVQVYATRENWPLFGRVTKVIRSLVEAGLVTMWRNLNVRKLYVAWKRKLLNYKRSFRNLEIRHIAFSFGILGIGYSCAALVFFVELLIGRYRARRLGKDPRISSKP